MAVTPDLAEAPPGSEVALVERARALAGRTLGDVAAARGWAVPADLRRHKGWVGRLIEVELGASAGSAAEPDFPALGIELKTIPVDRTGKALESTFVCTIALRAMADVEWESSWLRRKLRRVLWLPIEGLRQLAPAERRIGAPLLWSPSDEEERVLRFDWEELAGRIGAGHAESITGHLGSALQVRPKAANARSRRPGVDSDGERYEALPRGFYLRARFTTAILRRSFVVAERSTGAVSSPRPPRP